MLGGVDAAAFSSELELPDPHDLKVISSFLAEPPYGRLTVDEGTPEERAAQLLRRRARSPPSSPWPCRPPAWEVDDLTDYRALIRARLAHVVPVGEPLVLISQIQRSGGTLLLQLLDGHRQCHVDPYELKIGHPKKHNWPPLDLSRPETWFETLYFRGIVERIRRTERTRRPDAGRASFRSSSRPGSRSRSST